MAVTMKAIAEAAGVSSATVSKVLNGADQHISEATRQRILKCIQDMGYVPNNAARSLKTNQTRTIGFILPDITNPFFPEIVRGVEDAARRRNYALLICNTDNDPDAEKHALKVLSSKRVDGIIFTRGIRKISPKELTTAGLPIVVADRNLEMRADNFGQVYVDARRAFEDSTRVLVQAGCRRIAFISCRYPGTRNRRLEGYKSALAEADIPYDRGLVYLQNYDVETGRFGMEKLLAEGRDVDGVVCGDDLIALGVLETLRRQGLAVPEQVKVMGFDDIYISQYTSPALSTIHQPAYEMGARAAEMLMEYILHGTPMHGLKLDYKVILRETT